MCREHVNDNLWQRYRANRRPCLRRRQERRTAVDIHQLPIHLDSPAQKVDPVNGEPETFTLTHAGTGREDDQRPIPGRHRVGEREHGFDG